MKFNKDFLTNKLGLPFGYDGEEEYGNRVKILDNDNIVSQSRWFLTKELIFKFDDKIYRTYYNVGATECQYEEPWEYDDEVVCDEVELQEVIVKQWVKVDENS